MAIVECLVKKGASLEAVDGPLRWTPLMWAANRGALAVVEVILENIRDWQLIHAKDKNGNTALALALEGRKPLTAQAIHRADPSSK